MDPILLIVVALIIGLAAGLLSGMFGIGGGIIMVPAIQAAGLVSGDAAFNQATAASLFAIIFLSPTGSYVHMRSNHLNWRYGMMLGAGGIAGGVIGSYFSKDVPQALLSVGFALFALAMGVQMILKGRRKAAPVRPEDDEDIEPPEDADLDKPPVPASGAEAESMVCRMPNPLPYLALLGFAAGILAGFLGVGGGLIMVPVMVMLGIGIHVAIGTSLMAILFTAGASVITKASFNLLDIQVAMPLAVGGCIAAYVGAVIATRTHSKSLAGYFSVLLFAISAYMLLRSLGYL